MKYLTLILILFLFVGSVGVVSASPETSIQIQDLTNVDYDHVVVWYSGIPEGAYAKIYKNDTWIHTELDLGDTGTFPHSEYAVCAVEYKVLIFDEFENEIAHGTTYSTLNQCVYAVIEFSKSVYGCNETVIVSYQDIPDDMVGTYTIEIRDLGDGSVIDIESLSELYGSYYPSTTFLSGHSYQLYGLRPDGYNFLPPAIDDMSISYCSQTGDGEGDQEGEGDIGDVITPDTGDGVEGGLVISDSEILSDSETVTNDNYKLAAIMFGTAIAFLFIAMITLEGLKASNSPSKMVSIVILAVTALCGLLGIIGWAGVFCMTLITGIDLMTEG